MTSEYWSEVLKYLRIYGGDNTAIAVAQRFHKEAQESEDKTLRGTYEHSRTMGTD